MYSPETTEEKLYSKTDDEKYMYPFKLLCEENADFKLDYECWKTKIKAEEEMERKAANILEEDSESTQLYKLFKHTILHGSQDKKVKLYQKILNEEEKLLKYQTYLQNTLFHHYPECKTKNSWLESETFVNCC